jgi:gamma-glutamylcyclotransferase (GGCT)/AIG2-like uncharacterized protein YtfP
VEADGLFVYGTLREGGFSRSWLERTDPVGWTGARTPGRLFHLPGPGIPALVPGPEPAEGGPGWVVGEFVGYEDEAALEAAVQDLDPVMEADGGLYERRIVPVRLDSGHRYQAWAYVFPEDRLARLEKEAVELPGGDWAAYLG